MVSFFVPKHRQSAVIIISYNDDCNRKLNRGDSQVEKEKQAKQKR